MAGVSGFYDDAVFASAHNILEGVQAEFALFLFGVVAPGAFLVEDWLHPHGIKTGGVDRDFSLYTEPAT